MERQPFLTNVGLMKQSLTAMSRQFLSVLAILVLVPAVAAAGDPLSSWDKQINAKGRFEVLPAFDNAAVLDKETGLVWEQSPGDTNGDGNVDLSDEQDWTAASLHCIAKNVGGRKGWRLPSIPELASLVDPSQSNPALPAGHPFTDVQSSTYYWSAPPNAANATAAWRVFFSFGYVDTDVKTGPLFVWCVRGGMNADQY
jgi:uncharacterized protein DUF1566